MLLGNVVQGGSYRNTYHLPTGGEFVTNSEKISRPRNYSYIAARAYAVYPTNGEYDSYHRCKIKFSGYVRYQKMITSEVTLNDNNNSETHIGIIEGNLNASGISAHVAGNNPDKDAYADIYYAAN